MERRDRCCLCGNLKEQVTKLIVGLHGAVCDSCIGLCNDIMHIEQPKQKLERPETPDAMTVDIPSDITAALGGPTEVMRLLEYLAGLVRSRAARLESRAAETEAHHLPKA
ncbi:MAG TPA: ClpX C4-type zinc finger protein [Fimbriimonadaceae bacterium]|nr:ClpX C4-type zinc finger protein [Fimbriimonadaceae bacterium]